jgi:uncharacterized membrane protein YcaP (DUF421 family)
MDEAIKLLQALIGRDDEVISLGQMIARGVVVFAVGVALVRLAAPRLFSRATPIDIVLAVIIGSNLSRTMTGSAPFLPVIAATIVLVVLHAVLVRAAVSWRPLATLLKGRAHVLVTDGDVDANAMRRCAVGERDLMAAIRASGGSKLEDVASATLERDGVIEVVLRS